ncbi:MAG: hypothetical protein JW772_04790 [Candidatus Diapherotrites archaeon]|nr:hypothetical protein [Candidatus Diapherotrites archaeon]
MEEEQKEENVSQETKIEETKADEPESFDTKPRIRVKRSFINGTIIAVVFLVIGAVLGSFLIPSSGLAATPLAQGNTGDNAMSADAVGDKVIDYLNANFFSAQGMTAQLSNIEEQYGMYFVEFDVYQGEEVQGSLSVYATEDAKTMLVNAQVFDLDTALEQPEPEPSAEVQKSDKPEVELFVMSYCPYGTQMEKAVLPVVETLGDDIDFKLRFVYYAMHGETEVTEQTKQYCIQKEQNEKFVPYLSCFLKEGDTEACLAETEIDTALLEACVAAADTEFNITANLEDTASYLSGQFPLFDVDAVANAAYGVGGSPTLVINGTTVSVNRTPAAVLDSVCAAFNNAPEACAAELSTETPASGFGYEGTGTGNGSCS